MHFLALATDYDGTLAHGGVVDAPTRAALQRFKDTGRRLVLVTGRELPDLCNVYRDIGVFDRVVAENGALLYDPATGTETVLAEAPPPVLVERLKQKGVEPLSVGRVIVATWEPAEKAVLDVIRDLGLELQIIFNKGAVMVLPSGVNKASGLAAALNELGLSPRDVVAVGDAENDHAFMQACGCAAAVANALPVVKAAAGIRLQGERGAGVVELIDRILRDEAPCRIVRLTDLDERSRRRTLAREWLVTNGLGGYASGTIAGGATRRYHGLLVAALPAPLGRRLVFPPVRESLRLPDGTQLELSGAPQHLSAERRIGTQFLQEFRLEIGLPVWRYAFGGTVVEKRVLLRHGHNTAYLDYRLLDGEGPIELELRVFVDNRSHDDPVDTPVPQELRVVESIDRLGVTSRQPPALRCIAYGSQQVFTADRAGVPSVEYAVEKARGYAHVGELFSPGYWRMDLTRERPAGLAVSTESWDELASVTPEEVVSEERARRERCLADAVPSARKDLAAELVLAADQFVVRPVGRSNDSRRRLTDEDDRDSGNDNDSDSDYRNDNAASTVIAGYHWFTDWGRDTMISLEGLTLATGRHAEASRILRMFAHHVRDGLLPNLFPEGDNDGLYHTADATLWFFHALDRYVEATRDHALLEAMLPVLCEILEHHLRGTRFGIGVDPVDGLLRQGADGYALTWMDAKAGDWVVTPRRGKAVEINALWFNALCLTARWLRRAGGRDGDADRFAACARAAKASFNARFWLPAGGYLYDVVDGERGDDAALRPNQVVAIALPHPVLDRPRWESVMERVRRSLLTPFGLRTLSPDDPDYRARYSGDVRSRDASYHQGTVWPWLLGPFVDAWLKTHPEDAAAARGFLAGFDAHLNEGCIGSIGEIFDAEEPFIPGGCVAQAWSVAEILRSLIATDIGGAGGASVSGDSVSDL
jgi:HAD superfamily hydrolase (TIGR01484 family)